MCINGTTYHVAFRTQLLNSVYLCFPLCFHCLLYKLLYMDKSRPAAVSAASPPTTGPFVQTPAPQGPGVWVFTILDLLVLWNVCCSFKGGLVFLPLGTQIPLFRRLFTVPSPPPPPAPTCLAVWVPGESTHSGLTSLTFKHPSSQPSSSPCPPAFVTWLSAPGLAHDPCCHTHAACHPVASQHHQVHWFGVC